VIEMSTELVMGPEQGSSVVALLPLASRQACFAMAFLALVMKQLYRCAVVKDTFRILTKELRTAYRSPILVRILKSRTLRWAAEHIGRV
jgi:hypothetical protein